MKAAWLALLGLGACAWGPTPARVGPVREVVVEEHPGARPGWIDRVPESSAETLYFVGSSGLRSDEEEARVEALASAVRGFAGYCGVAVETVAESLAASTSRASGVTDPAVARRVSERATVEAFVSRIKGAEWYSRRVEQRAGRAVVAVGWRAWVLARVPEEEVGRVERRREEDRTRELASRRASARELCRRAGEFAAAARAERASRPLEALGLYLDALEALEGARSDPDAYAEAVEGLTEGLPAPEAEIGSLLAALTLSPVDPAVLTRGGGEAEGAAVVLAACAGAPLPGARVLFTSGGESVLVPVSEEGRASFAPRGGEGRRPVEARLDHPNLRRAAARFRVPEPVVFAIEPGPERSAARTREPGLRVDATGGWVEATALGTADVRACANAVEAEAAARRAARHMAYALLAESVSVRVEATADGRREAVVGARAELRGARVVAESCEWTDDPARGGRAPRALVTVALPLSAER